MKIYLKASIYFLLSLGFIQSNAQTVIHIENQRLAQKDTGFSGTIEMTANFIQNINDIFQTVNSAQMQFVKGKSSFLSISAFNLTILNGNRIVNESFQHLRHSYTLNKTLAWETFGQGQYNEIIKIRNRHLLGSGMRFAIKNTDSLRLFSGTLLMREWERETTNILNKHFRVSQYVSIGFPIGEYLKLDFISYYQPDILNLSDFRASAEATLNFRLTRKLRFRFAHSLFYDAEPPEGIRNLFYNFRNGLTFNF